MKTAPPPPTSRKFQEGGGSSGGCLQKGCARIFWGLTDLKRSSGRCRAYESFGALIQRADGRHAPFRFPSWLQVDSPSWRLILGDASSRPPCFSEPHTKLCEQPSSFPVSEPHAPTFAVALPYLSCGPKRSPFSVLRGLSEVCAYVRFCSSFSAPQPMSPRGIWSNGFDRRSDSAEEACHEVGTIGEWGRDHDSE